MVKKGFLFSLLVALLLVGVVHFFVFTLVTVPGQGEEPTLLSGDRVVVNRWSYGFRTPYASRWGYRRWRSRMAHHNDWVVYNASLPSRATSPDTMQLCVGRCLALPGDTVWMGAHGRVSRYRSYASGQIWPIVVPAKGSYIRMNPWNVQLYAATINGLEGGQVSVQDDSLCVKGRKVAYYCFSRNYYWMTSSNEENVNDSRMMGFIPETHLLGKIELVLYSFDGYRPRWSRLFRPRL